MPDVTNANGSISTRFNGQPYLFYPQPGLTGVNRDNTTGWGNLTLFQDPDHLCNPSICELTLAAFEYIPSLGGNALYAGILGLYLILNIGFGVRYKTWGYMAAMSIGLAGEVVGYVGRLLLYGNIFDPTGNNFLIYLVCLTISPALLSAAIYLCLARIVVVYGEHMSYFKPRTYTLFFCGCDVFSLILQAGGGGIASSATTKSGVQTGIDVMLAGLGVQVVSLFTFAIMCLEFAWRLSKNKDSWNKEHALLYNSKLWKAFLIGLGVAVLTIFVRSVFRVAELSGGFRGPLANEQVTFMLLEGMMIVIACSALTLLHPGITFRGSWDKANFKFRAGGKKVVSRSESDADADLEMS